MGVSRSEHHRKMKLPLSFCILIAIFCNVDCKVPLEVPEGGKLWALLVAGSSGYENYRHQADVCHAYQVNYNLKICHSKSLSTNSRADFARSRNPG